MMNILEEAIIYATIMHQGKTRKHSSAPFILHPLEVAQILSTMTEDQEVIASGILHDIVEATDGTLSEIEKRFGRRVANLVSSETEEEYPDESMKDTWKRRKEGSLDNLKSSRDIGVKMLWLADKLANIRSLVRMYSEQGEAMWQHFNQDDPAMQLWYYKTVAESLELSLNRTGAFKEFTKHINFIWPGTFDSEKARFREYFEVSVENCKLLGKGAKGEVYRYDDELVIKVFNSHNTFHDVENEIALSRKAFVLGVPTAISFGIVSVGDRYGAVYELVDSETVSRSIAKAPGQVDTYARLMADLARGIHSTHVPEDQHFPPVYDRVSYYIHQGVECEDEALGRRCLRLLEALPPVDTLVHGDFHTGNVFIQNGEPLLIDMDRISRGHPIAELSDLHYFYVALGEDDPASVERFMGFSSGLAREFFDLFLRHYLKTEDENRIREVREKASLLSWSRLILRIRNKKSPGEADQALLGRCLRRIKELTDQLDTLDF